MLAWPLASWGVRGRWSYVDVASVSVVRCCAYPYVRRPRDVSAVRELHSRGEARRCGSLLSSSRSLVLHMPARAASGLCIRRAYLFRLCLFFFVLRLVGGARQTVRGGDDRAPGPVRG